MYREDNAPEIEHDFDTATYKIVGVHLLTSFLKSHLFNFLFIYSLASLSFQLPTYPTIFSLFLSISSLSTYISLYIYLCMYMSSKYLLCFCLFISVSISLYVSIYLYIFFFPFSLDIHIYQSIYPYVYN